MKKSELRKLIREEISNTLNEGGNSIVDFLNQNFTIEEYSYTPLNDFTFTSKGPFSKKGESNSVEANVPIGHSYRNFTIADIIMEEFPEVSSKEAYKHIAKWNKQHKK